MDKSTFFTGQPVFAQTRACLATFVFHKDGTTHRARIVSYVDFPRFCKIVNDKLIPGRSAGFFARYLYL